MEITSGQPTVQVGGGCGNGMGWGGDGLMFLAFLAMMGGFGGGRWGRNDMPSNVATTDTVNQAVQYASLADQNRAAMAETQRQGNATNMFVADKYMELQRDIANNGMSIQNVLARFSECCCEIQREIDAQTLDFTKQNYENRISNDKQFCQLREDMNRQFCELNRRMDLDENRRLRETVDNLKDDMRMFRLMNASRGYGGYGGCCDGGNWLPGFGA